MADIEGLITISNSEYRRCTVDSKRAVFHRWHEFCEVVDASPLMGGHPGGQIEYTMGTVEYEDGTVDEVSPCRIKFCDNRVKEVWEDASQEGKV